MSGDPELIAAAILLPKFRTTWIKDDATIKIGKKTWGWTVKKIWVWLYILTLCNIGKFTNTLWIVHETKYINIKLKQTI